MISEIYIWLISLCFSKPAGSNQSKVFWCLVSVTGESISDHNQTARLQQTAAKPEIDKSKREMSALQEKGAPDDGGLSKTKKSVKH